MPSFQHIVENGPRQGHSFSVSFRILVEQDLPQGNKGLASQSRYKCQLTGR